MIETHRPGIPSRPDRGANDTTETSAGSRIAGAGAAILWCAMMAAAPAAQAQDQTIVENFGQGTDHGLEVGDVAQTFETGPNTGGYTVTRIRFEARARPHPAGTSSTLRAMLCNVDASGKPPDNLGFCTWTGTVRFFDAGDLDFELERAVRLLPNTKYAIVADRTAGANPPLNATASGSADSTSSGGWDIGAGGRAWEWKMTKRQNGTFHERWERVPWERYLRFGLYGRFDLLNEPNGGNPPVFRDDDDLVELTIAENQDAGANVGSRLSDIVDRRGQTVTYRIVPDIAGNDIGGPDGDLFDINPRNGQITTKQPFDFESAPEYYQFGVSASNAIGASNGVNVRVRVTDVNEPLEPLALCDGISSGGRGILCGTDPDPGEFWVRARSDTEIKVNWARPNPARGVPGPRSYLVVHRTGTTGPFDSHRVEASSAPGYAHTIEGLQPDTTYQVRVIVNNGEGNASSEIVTVRTHAHPQYAFRFNAFTGTNPQVGRPEFFFRGKWGTVTDHRADEAGNEAAALMCRLANFEDGEFIALPRGQLASLYVAAPATMPIWLDDLRCPAGATDINQCSHAGWGESNGDHSEDLWVRCWKEDAVTKGPAPNRAYIEHGAARWVYIQFDTTLASEDGKTPDKSRFQVDVAAPGTTNFVPMAIDSVNFYPNSGRVRLVLPREIAWNESVQVGYADPNPNTNDATGALEDRLGFDAETFLSYDVDNEVRDEIPPNLTAGETSADGNTVTVWFTEPLDRDVLPDPERFTVRVVTREVVADENGFASTVETNHDATPSTVAFATAGDLSADARGRIAGKSECSAAPHTCALVLTASERIRGQDLRTYNFENGSSSIPVRSGHNAVKVRYADPSSANDSSGVVQDAYGNDARNSHFATVKNRTTYGRGLLPVAAFVSAGDASTTNLVFEWPLSDEDFPSSSELLSAFSLTAGGSPATDLEVSRDSNADNRLVFEHHAFTRGDTVTISYAKPTSGNLLKDGRGIEVASFTGYPVANPASPIQFENAWLETARDLLLRFDKDLDPRFVPPLGSFSVSGSAGNHALDRVALDPDDARVVRVYSEALPFSLSDPGSLTVTYTRPANGGLRSADGVEIPFLSEDVIHLPEIDVDDVTVTEGEDATADFVVTLTPAHLSTVTVDYETEDVTAVAPDDYTATSGTLTFAPGDTQMTVSVPIVDDAVEDGGETFTLRLSNLDRAEFVSGGSMATATINNDDNGNQPLTAEFTGAPASHGGQPFTVELAFSEELPLSYRTLQGGDGQAGAIDVAGGAVTGAARVSAGENRRWTITVEPDGTGGVTLTLPATTDCEAEDAICTEDDRPLSAAVTATVPDQEPVEEEPVEEENLTPALTAAFSGAPASHGGQPFTLELAFSEELSLSYRTLQGGDGQAGAIDVAGGAVTRAERVIADENRRWTITVEPDGTGDVTVTLPATADCEAADAICTEDDRPLSAAVTVSVPNEEPGQEPPVQEQVVADPLTVRLAGVPAEHDGSDSVSFEVHFSEEPHEYSYRTLRDTTLRVAQGGTSITPHVKRMQSGSNQSWTVTVEPVSQAALDIAIAPTPDCNAADAVCTEGGEPLSNAVSATVAGPPGLFVADARVREAAGATLDFAVTLSRASASTVTVDYATSDGSATAGQDYTSVSGTLTFNAGETAKTVSAPVLDDAHDDGGETLTLTLSNPSGGNAYLADGTATGTIENADPQPQAWLARFGRGAAMQTVDLLTDRFEDAAMGDNRLTLGGRSLDPSFLRMQESRGTTGRPADDTAFHRMPQNARGQGTSALTPSIGESGGTACPEGTPCNDGHDDPAQDRRATPLEQAAYQLLSQRGRLQFDARRFLSQSSFNLSLSDPGRDAGEAVETVRAAPEPAGHWSLWGRGAMTRFNGVDEGVRMDGDVLTGLVGVDYARDRWLAGAALAWHDGDGAYTSARGGGALDSTLITVSPYLRYAFTERLSAWGTVGYGTGSLTLRPDTGGGAGEAIETDLGTTMGAAGLRGVVYASAATELALKSDALWVRTTSAETAGLRSAEADATRIRLLLSGRHQRTLANDALLVPGFELGLRYDGGDAETGFGVELGGGLRYEDALRGLRIETKARALLAHEDGGYQEWGVSGSVSLDPGRLGRGLALSLASGWGLAESGAEAMWQRQGAAGLSAQHDSPVQGRLTVALGYGLDVPWTYGILTPYSGMEWAGQRRTLTLGWRFNLGQSLRLSLDGERRESAYEATDHGVMLNTSLPW